MSGETAAVPVSLVAARRHPRGPASRTEGPADVLELRVEHDDDQPGVSLGQARVLLVGVARLMQAAAMAAMGPAPRFAGRRPDAVKAFVEQDIRFAHAEVGSPLLAVHTRLDEDPAPVMAGGRAVPVSWATGMVRLAPFQRRVGTTLAGALAEVSEAIRDHRAARRATPAAPDGQAAEAAPSPLVLRGVSVDLCDALLAMVAAPRVDLLELAFYWAPRPGLDSPAVLRVALRRDDTDALLQLRDTLLGLPDQARTAVYGQVTRLDRGDADDGGLVTIHGVVGRSTQRTVQISLSGGEYDAAIRAYRTRAPVIATGRLRRIGGIHVLTGQFTVTGAAS